jgi:hypothetical protein
MEKKKNPQEVSVTGCSGQSAFPPCKQFGSGKPQELSSPTRLYTCKHPVNTHSEPPTTEMAHPGSRPGRRAAQTPRCDGITVGKTLVTLTGFYVILLCSKQTG